MLYCGEFPITTNEMLRDGVLVLPPLCYELSLFFFLLFFLFSFLF